MPCGIVSAQSNFFMADSVKHVDRLNARFFLLKIELAFYSTRSFVMGLLSCGIGMDRPRIFLSFGTFGFVVF